MEVAQSDIGVVALMAARAVGALAILASLVPLVRTGAWPVRIADFPRVQVAVACVGALLVEMAFGGSGRDFWFLAYLVGLVAALAMQVVAIVPYTRLWRLEVGSSDLSDLRLLVANLDVRNGDRRRVARALESVDADVLLLIEVDRDWHDALYSVRERLDHRVESVRPDGLGIALWSRFPLEDGGVRHVVSGDRPSIDAVVRTRSGRACRLFGVHPTPPGLAERSGDGRHDSRIRDAELVLIARDVEAERSHPCVVAGDFNDVAWSRTSRLFKRISGLRDPRVGRGLLSTYHARLPPLRYPLDHVFVSPGATVGALERRRIPGSDHFGVLIDLGLRDASVGGDPSRQNGDADRESSLVGEGVRDACATGA